MSTTADLIPLTDRRLKVKFEEALQETETHRANVLSALDLLHGQREDVLYLRRFYDTFMTHYLIAAKAAGRLEPFQCRWEASDEGCSQAHPTILRIGLGSPEEDGWEELARLSLKKVPTEGKLISLRPRAMDSQHHVWEAYRARASLGWSRYHMLFAWPFHAALLAMSADEPLQCTDEPYLKLPSVLPPEQRFTYGESRFSEGRLQAKHYQASLKRDQVHCLTAFLHENVLWHAVAMDEYLP